MRIIFENNHVLEIGKYKDVIVEDYANARTYIYDACGTHVTLPHDTNLHRSFVNDDVITIEHNLGKYPSVTIIDSAGHVVFGDVDYASTVELTVTLSEPITGTIALN